MTDMKDKSTAALQAQIEERLHRQYQTLLADGNLLSKETLDAAYARFAAAFDPASLGSLDGRALLERIHDHGKRDSLVYWLEFKDDDEIPAVFGSIAGHSALKFGIYRRKETGAWMTGPAQSQRAISEDEAIAIARRNRDQLVAAADVMAHAPDDFEDATYAEIQRRLFEVAPDVADAAWAHKYLHMLFPTRLDDYHVTGYQRHHLIKLLERPPVVEGRYAAAGRFAALAAHLGWPMVHLGTTLNALNGRPNRYWRIGTSDATVPRNRWPLMRDGSVVAIGWDRLGDLSSLSHDRESREQLKTLLGEHYPNTPQANGNLAQQIFNFATAIEERHLVLACDGGTVLGIGRVTGPYQFVTGTDFPHQRAVKWLDLSEWRLPKPEALLTAVREIRLHIDNLLAVEERVLHAGTAARPLSLGPSQPAAGATLSMTPAPAMVRRAPPLEGIAGEIQRVLDRKGQVILYGPPGTGKTHWAEFTANQLAAYWAFGKPFDALDAREREAIAGLVRICCFHPSYGYEDFIEGHRPEVAPSGGLNFRLHDGVFKRFCRAAERDPERRYYLLVDEINRGDIPRIFGELLTLLEPSRRSRIVELSLSGESFSVPRNVYLIGTMNTADRSIALLDTALRRRFGFVELMPQPDLLGSARVADIPLGPWLRTLNEHVCREIGRDARNLQVGHSYLLHAGKPIADLAHLRRVLVEDLLPLLEEYCYDDWDKLERILGTKLVDGAAQRFRRELFEPAAEEQFVAALVALDPEVLTTREATRDEPPLEGEPPEMESDESGDDSASSAGG